MPPFIPLFIPLPIPFRLPMPLRLPMPIPLLDMLPLVNGLPRPPLPRPIGFAMPPIVDEIWFPSGLRDPFSPFIDPFIDPLSE